MRGVVLGPVMSEEGELLRAVVQMIKPTTAVEFGYMSGVSASYIIGGLNGDARLISYDPQPKEQALEDPRHILLLKGQETICFDDVGGKPIDFVFWDGSHQQTLNLQTYHAITPLLSDKCIMAVHDTGYWDTLKYDYPSFGVIVNGHYRAHQPDELLFCDYLAKNGWHRIDFCPTHVVRHGISFFQRH